MRRDHFLTNQAPEPSNENDNGDCRRHGCLVLAAASGLALGGLLYAIYWLAFP